MTEPTIIWPNCKTEIRLTESLAAPLIAATRKQFEQQPSQKDEEIAKRELELTVEKRVQEGLGDVLQRVVSQSSQQAGTILWECKRTKIGATAGSSSSARTSVLPKPRFPSSSARCFPKASKPSMSLTAYG